MILRRLLVERFAGLNPGALIAAFGERVTLIHGPNEAGKSTLLAAIEHVLYQRHKAGGAEVEAAIVPRGATVAPRVELDFEIAGEQFRLRKQFVSKPSAELSVRRGERFEVLAEADAADDELARRLRFEHKERRLGGPELRGIGEVLLVPQGRLRFTEKLGDRAREQLLPLMGGVATTTGAHELLGLVRDRWKERFTEARGEERKGSPLEAARREAAEIASELARLAARLDEARAIERGLVRDPHHDATQAERRKEQEAQREQARSARDLVRGLTAKRDAAAQLESAAATAAQLAAQRVAEIAATRATRAKAIAARDAAAQEHARAQEAAALAAKEFASAREAAEAIEQQRAALEVEEAALRDAEERGRVLASATARSERLAKDAGLATAHAAAEQRLAQRARPRRDDVKRIRTLRDEQEKLAQRLAATELRVTFAAEREVELRGPAGPTPLAAGASAELRGADPLAIEIAGVGKLTVRGPDVPERATLEQRRRTLATELEELTRPFGNADGDALDELLQERQSIEAELKKLAEARAELFADEAARRGEAEQLAREKATLARLEELHPEWRAAPPTADSIVARRDGVAERRRQQELAFRSARATLERAQKQHDGERERAAAAAAAMAAAGATAESAQRQLEAQQADGKDDAQRATEAAQAQRQLATRREEAAELAAELERHGDVEARLRTAEQALAEFDAHAAKERDEQARLRGRLEQVQRDALWQQQGDLEARQLANGDALARAELDAAALKLLKATLDQAQEAQLDALVRPLAAKVSRMLAPVLDARVEVRFGERLLPESLARDQRPAIETDRLSAGTHDQVALATRLALGELWSAQHGRHALLLDDPLVNSDPGRRARLLPILARAAESLQLVIFTCDPGAWLGLPADTVRVSIDEARRACEARS